MDEDYHSFGLSGEIAATITERNPTLLTHFSRVCMPDTLIPYAQELEYAVLPTATRKEAAVRKAVAE